jgi:hypothetical protein
MVSAVAARAVQPLQIKASQLHVNQVTCLLDLSIWSDIEPSDLMRTNVNLRVPYEVAMVFDKR